MYLDDQDVLAHRLNFDAAIFCGCTLKEMQVIVILNLIVSILLLCCLAKLLINMFLVGVGLAFPVTVGMSWLSATILQKIKYGKPKGYIKQAFTLWLEDLGVITPIYLRRSGKWSGGRK